MNRYRLNYLEDGLRKLRAALGDVGQGDPFDVAVARLGPPKQEEPAPEQPFKASSYPSKASLAAAFAERYARDLDQSLSRAEMEAQATKILAEMEGASA